jgi:hypothetical protein
VTKKGQAQFLEDCITDLHVHLKKYPCTLICGDEGTPFRSTGYEIIVGSIGMKLHPAVLTEHSYHTLKSQRRACLVVGADTGQVDDMIRLLCPSPSGDEKAGLP